MITPERAQALMNQQLDRLEQKRAELDAVGNYLRAKIDWMKAGSQGPEPDFSAYVPGAAFTGCEID